MINLTVTHVNTCLKRGIITKHICDLDGRHDMRRPSLQFQGRSSAGISWSNMWSFWFLKLNFLTLNLINRWLSSVSISISCRHTTDVTDKRSALRSVAFLEGGSHKSECNLAEVRGGAWKMLQRAPSQSCVRSAMTSATRSTTTIRRMASVHYQRPIFVRVSTRHVTSSTSSTVSPSPRSTAEVVQTPHSFIHSFIHSFLPSFS